MRKALAILTAFVTVAALIGAIGFSLAHPGKARAAACLPTDFMRDGMVLTAAMVDPVGTVSGKVDATGCNIGVYYSLGTSGTINNAEIFGANYFGVVNNGGNVTITQSNVHNIGETPFDGTQHGVGIYFADGSMATGSITGNYISNYQKGGIVVNGVGSSATISFNAVIGLGPVDFIAQNGIEVGDGAKATVNANTVTGNSYTGSGPYASGGILVFGGACYSSALTVGIHMTNNILVGNDVGAFLSNLDVNSSNNCVAPSTPTKLVTHANTIRNDAVNNTSGNGPGAGYQAGVSDQGNSDQITNNKICGKGYTHVTPPPYLYRIDVSGSKHPIVKGNTGCGKGNTTVAITMETAPHLLVASAVR